jgi:protein KRI1
MLSDSDSEDVAQLTINEHFANAYAYRKEREELQKRPSRAVLAPCARR